jgi:uncharacterized membrane protein HdeD (DUF308 family)
MGDRRKIRAIYLALRGALILVIGLWVLFNPFDDGPDPRPWISYLPVGTIAVICGSIMLADGIWEFFRNRTSG